MEDFSDIPKTQCIVELIGCPANGKSTYAKALFANRKGFVIINRDSIREGRGAYNVPNQEDYISDVEESMVKLALNRGLSVIIDATNLNPKTQAKWDRISVEFDVDLIKKFFYIPFYIALQRDIIRSSNGGRFVGEKVLKRFYSQYYPKEYKEEVLTDICPSKELNLDLPDAVIFDLDQTLMYRQGRDIYDYDNAGTDYFDPRAKQLIMHLILSSVNILIVTGREITEKSLEAINKSLKGLSKDVQIFGRKVGDNRGGLIVKEELYINYIKPYYNVLAAFDDHKNTVDMYRKYGIFACKIN